MAPPFDPDGINFTKFAELCKRTVMHYNDLWDNGYQYDINYWEIWNEPDGIFWQKFRGSEAIFYDLYKEVSTTLKQYDPTLKVGALGATPGTIILNKEDYYRGFFSYISQNNLPLIFILSTYMAQRIRMVSFQYQIMSETL